MTKQNQDGPSNQRCSRCKIRPATLAQNEIPLCGNCRSLISDILDHNHNTLKTFILQQQIPTWYLNPMLDFFAIKAAKHIQSIIIQINKLILDSLFGANNTDYNAADKLARIYRWKIVSDN